MKITENGQKIITYLRNTNNDNAVAADIAGKVGLTVPQVNGSVTALAKKGLVYRDPVEIIDGEDTKVVKFIKLTDAGQTCSFDEE